MKRLLFLLLAFVSIASTQDAPIRWTGEVRFRSEADGRDFKLSTPMNLFTLSRLRLGAIVRPAEHVTLSVKFQDSRTFGQEASTVTNSANVDLYEGRLTVDSLACGMISLSLGRMPLAYGSERFLGTLGWNNVGRSFDGFTMRMIVSDVQTDLIALNVSDVNAAPASVSAAGTAYTYDKGVGLYGLYSTFAIAGTTSADVYLFYERNGNQTKKDTIDYTAATIGGALRGKADAFSFDAEAAAQFGSSKGSDVSAFMAAVMAGYAIPNATLSAVSLHADLVSGTKAGSSAANTFLASYATGHKYFGYMDYFTNFPVQTFNRGLMDLYLRTQFVWGDRWKSQATLHHFTTMEPFTASAPLNVSDLGQELDLITNYKQSPALGLEFGLGLFNPNTLMRTAFGGSDVGVWGYVMTTVSF